MGPKHVSSSEASGCVAKSANKLIILSEKVALSDIINKGKSFTGHKYGLNKSAVNYICEKERSL
jgi:hypothetical protein